MGNIFRGRIQKSSKNDRWVRYEISAVQERKWISFDRLEVMLAFATSIFSLLPQ
jgi:hypothetical protein